MTSENLLLVHGPQGQGPSRSHLRLVLLTQLQECVSKGYGRLCYKNKQLLTLSGFRPQRFMPSFSSLQGDLGALCTILTLGSKLTAATGQNFVTNCGKGKRNSGGFKAGNRMLQLRNYIHRFS